MGQRRTRAHHARGILRRELTPAPARAAGIRVVAALRRCKRVGARLRAAGNPRSHARSAFPTLQPFPTIPTIPTIPTVPTDQTIPASPTVPTVPAFPAFPTILTVPTQQTCPSHARLG